MSNRILTTWASEGQPLQAPLHLDFLQDATKEAIANTIIGIIGDSYDPTQYYRLFGAVLTNFSGDNYTNSAGAIFYAGEVYTVDVVGGSGTSMPDGMNMHIVTSATDSTVFYAGGTHAVNQVRKMKYVNNVVTQLPVEIRLNTVASEVTLTPSTNVTFEVSKNFLCSITGGDNYELVLDATNAVVGAKVCFLMNCDSNTFTVTGGGSYRIVKQSGTGVFGLTESESVEIEYYGQGGSGYFFGVKYSR